LEAGFPILDQLKAIGSEQTCKTYRKHGESYADLKNLKKKIKGNDDLTQQL